MAFKFKHFIFFIYVIVLILLTSTTASISLDKECVALFEFKQSILYQSAANLDASSGFHKFDSWGKITSNKNSSNVFDDCCLWDGIMCSNNNEAGHHVIGIDLGESLVSGRISSNSTLFDLVHLKSLNLSMNDFSESQIPSEISRLKHLTSLDLSYSGFYGQIPHEISHLTKLTFLDLSSNPLKLLTPASRLLQNMTRLEELNLSGVNISSSVPRFLANFTSLRNISFTEATRLNVAQNSNLTGSLPEFRNNTLFEHLLLAFTGFSGVIPTSISNLNRVVNLVLSECYFSGSIPQTLSNLTQLTNLGLGQNGFSGQVPSLGSLSKLLILGLSDNEFDKGPMPDWIGKLTNLQRLYLNRLNIYDEILPSLANLTQLLSVSIRENYIFAPVPVSFMNLTQLIEIDLRGNQLQGPISKSFSNFKSLQYLSLDDNNFSGTVNLDTFLGLNKLQSLYLSDNRVSFVSTKNYTDGIIVLPELRNLGLSSCNLKEFPPFLRFQAKLEVLLLDKNKIEGLIPMWMWNNSKETLRVLDLSYNFITGFPNLSQFLPWAHLQAFSITYNQLQGPLPIPPKTIVFYDFSKNNLTGEIPSLLCELTSLLLLDLSSNKMSGTLPPCIGNLSSSLSVLDLKRNNFHGTMMNTFTYGSQLKRIDFSENRFVGQLPKSLVNCTRLEVLSLGDNSFDDIFPSWLGALEELKVLILRSNNFYGAVHQSPTSNYKSDFSNLRIIDLSNNGFTGPLPDKYFQSWDAMKSVYAAKPVAMSLEVNFGRGFGKVYQYSMTLTNKGVKREYERILNIFTAIDLSSNKFEGQIPPSLQELRGLESLNLSNNDLSGRVLTSLGNLKNLESLDLSQNMLTGKIPQELLKLGFLAIVNVSNNLLDGHIPQGKQFNTFENNSYIGNPGLCGQPLSNECEDSKATTPSLTSNNNESEYSGSLLPTGAIDWTVIFSGVVSGFVTGIVFLRSRFARYSDWLIERFGLKKDRWKLNFFAKSEIPPEIARLTQLKSLDLSKSNFTAQLPFEILQLVQLCLLDLSWNSLALQSPNFEILVKRSTLLEELHVSGGAHGPLIDHVSPRMIMAAGFQLSSKVIELIHNGLWKWPVHWVNYFPNLDVPRLMGNQQDQVQWQDRGGRLGGFSVGNAWEVCLGVNRKADINQNSTDWDSIIVNGLIASAKNRSFFSVVAKLMQRSILFGRREMQDLSNKGRDRLIRW
uniref:receptor-like protein 6 n=1 Tax=Erigeron canadensis TaxID=72917 RepID=UPI001CB8F2D1|nr:receptor-like protein 6 [Erigeron canadensis]